MMEVEDGDVVELVHDVWSSIIGLDLRPAAPGEAELHDRSMTGFVHIQGVWQGTVTVRLPESLAAEAAAAMFGMELDELVPADIDDALGELANMIGGGVKSLLPGPCQLSLPTVVGGLDYGVGVPGSTLVRQLRFVDPSGRPVIVAILEVGTTASTHHAHPTHLHHPKGA